MTLKKALTVSEIAVIVIFAIVPLFLSLPYRVNIFLSWEGAYRISSGEIPFRDFGIPLGGMYWVVPAIFFKIFGPQMISLVKAQVLINIISGLAFRSVLKSLEVQPSVRFSGILLYCLSFSFINFWPWYNHTVVVYAFVALAFVIKMVMNSNNRFIYWWAGLAGLFTFFSFFTKQDGGGLILLVCSALLLYNSWVDKKWMGLAVYLFSTIAFTSVAVLFFSRYDFSYWFNHGQPPHNARVSASDIFNGFFGSSQWLKFYFFLIALLIFSQIKDQRNFIRDKQFMAFSLMTLGILCFAAIFQVTSYTPDNCNIFFHSFAFVFIFHYLGKLVLNNQSLFRGTLMLSLGVLLWWSHLYWNYMQRILKTDTVSSDFATSSTGENIVNMHNAIMSKDTFAISQGKWIPANFYTLHKMTMPEPTVQGVERILNMEIVKNNKDIKVLNMSELTFLAKEMPYKPEHGPQYPLWFHLGVGMFNREARMFEEKIRNNYYDLVLFEYIDDLNNFYPFRIRDVLKANYRQVDSFFAPRNTNPGMIEVYIKKQPL